MPKPKHTITLDHAVILLLAALTAGCVAYDIWCIADGRVKDGFYVYPVIFVTSILILAKLESLRSAPSTRVTPEEDRKVEKDSYLHPDHHPKGRRDAPDGQSD